jgi:hypothetical protein
LGVRLRAGGPARQAAKVASQARGPFTLRQRSPTRRASPADDSAREVGTSARGWSGSAGGKSGFSGQGAFYAPTLFCDPPSLRSVVLGKVLLDSQSLQSPARHLRRIRPPLINAHMGGRLMRPTPNEGDPVPDFTDGLDFAPSVQLVVLESLYHEIT